VEEPESFASENSAAGKTVFMPAFVKSMEIV
jgi:hypothetical protein